MSSFKTIQIHHKGKRKKHFKREKQKNRTSIIYAVVAFFRDNPIFCILSTVLLAGIVVGSVAAQYTDQRFMESLDFIFLNNFELRGETNFVDIFLSSAATTTIFLILIIAMGLSVWGEIAIPLMCLLRGFSIGVVSSFLCINYSLQGFGFNLLVILPGAIISSAAIIICSIHSFEFSRIVVHKCFDTKRTPKRYYGLNTFRKKVQKSFVLMGVSALLDGILSLLLSGILSPGQN